MSALDSRRLLLTARAAFRQGRLIVRLAVWGLLAFPAAAAKAPKPALTPGGVSDTIQVALGTGALATRS